MFIFLILFGALHIQMYKQFLYNIYKDATAVPRSKPSSNIINTTTKQIRKFIFDLEEG